MWEDVKFTQQMHFLLSWPRRGGEGVPGPFEGGGRELRATPSPYHSCPGHMEGFWFFFVVVLVSAKVPWVLGKCLQEMQKIRLPVIRELLGKCWDDALCSQHQAVLWYSADMDWMSYKWDLVLAPSMRSSLRSAGWGAQAHETAPLSDATHKSRLSPVLLTPWGQIGDFHDPSLGFD